jgi:GntR family transcriptional regulator, transcriptional repressor for pyruvate dehydrogenase complex
MVASWGRRTLSSALADDLLREIRDGKYGVGDSLPTLQDLMAQHGVGYGVAREAMQQLVALGIADIRPKRGAIVLQVDAGAALDDATLAALLSDQAVEDLYELRRLIEVAIAGQAASHVSPPRLSAIREAQARFERAADDGRGATEADVDLHAAIAAASDNMVFIKVLEALRGVLSGVRAQVASYPGATDSARHEHGVIVDAIEAGDEDAARAAMNAHIDTAKAFLLNARHQKSPRLSE